MNHSLLKLAILYLVPLALAIGCSTHPTTSIEQASSHHRNKHHHRNPAGIQEYLTRLDRPERDQYQKPHQVIEALTLTPNMAIADVGSGSGYFTRRFVEALNQQGQIYAVDVEPQMLNYVKDNMGKAGAHTNVTFILAQADNPGLPDQSVDLIFLCNVYHHLEKRPAYFKQAKRTLRQNGRVAIIDFYDDHRSGRIGFPRRHLVSRDTVIQEMKEAGFLLSKEHSFLERQYFLEFVQLGQ